MLIITKLQRSILEWCAMNRKDNNKTMSIQVRFWLTIAQQVNVNLHFSLSASLMLETLHNFV
jgi:hypothetical protein